MKTTSYRGVLRKAGIYQNLTESEFVTECNKRGLEWDKRGYPDFSIIKDGEIVGFVEVKKVGQKLRKGQERFKRFCEKQGIPFYVWTTNEPFPPL